MYEAWLWPSCLLFFLCHRFPAPTKSSRQKSKLFSVQWAARQRWRQKALRPQDRMKANLGPAPRQPRGQDNWQVPRRAAMPSPELISKSGSAVSRYSQHPGRPAREANPLLQTTRWLCSASSGYLQFKTSVFTPWPITEGCFPWKGSITASLLVPTMCPFNIFFFPPQERSACCYFQHPPHVLEAIHALGHMARTAEIFPVGPRRGFSSKKNPNIIMLQRPHSPCTAQHTRQIQYMKKFAFDNTQSESPMESQRA